MRDWPPCPPIQWDGGWRSRPGVNPFISALTVARCPATFPGVWPNLWTFCPQVRARTRDGAFIYALSADEISSALAAVAPQAQPCLTAVSNGNADRAYNTLHFATQSRVPKGAPLETPPSVSRLRLFPLGEKEGLSAHCR